MDVTDDVPDISTNNSTSAMEIDDGDMGDDATDSEDKVATFVDDILTKSFPPTFTISHDKRQALTMALRERLENPEFLRVPEKFKCEVLLLQVRGLVDERPNNVEFNRVAILFLEDIHRKGNVATFIDDILIKSFPPAFTISHDKRQALTIALRELFLTPNFLRNDEETKCRLLLLEVWELVDERPNEEAFNKVAILFLEDIHRKGKVATFVDDILTKSFPPAFTISHDKRQALTIALRERLEKPNFLMNDEETKVDIIHGAFNRELVDERPNAEEFNKVAILFLKEYFASSTQEIRRMVPIDYKIVDTKLSHPYDLTNFKKTVLKVAEEWNLHKDAKTPKYIAPYFCFIQSSGMGKTKIMYEFANLVNTNVALDISCDLVVSKNGLLPNKEKVFAMALDFDQFASTTNKTKDWTWDASNDQFASTTNKKKAWEASKDVQEYLNRTFPRRKMRNTHIILFDEAQFLLSELFNEPAFFFRCIRVWLRAKKANGNQTVIAVFAGTSADLNNYNHNDDKLLEVRSASREAGGPDYYKSGPNTFPPFMCTTTMGVLLDPSLGDTEYHKSIGYGRPLFAIMHKNDDLDPNISTVLQRLILSNQNSPTPWSANELSWLSVLSTRVQMGSTAVNSAAQLVAKGYANLTSAYDGETATFSCLPDPVCARLAMCMMDETFAFQTETVTIGKIQGKSKTWWVERVKVLYSTGMCRPDRGDVGEVLVALYFLLCGDECRQHCVQNNEDYHTFSIPLCSWISSLLLDQSSLTAEHSNHRGQRRKRGHLGQEPGGVEVNSCPTSHSVEVSFIQVCRNSLRCFGESWGIFADQEFLGHLYTAGTAFYMYPGCPLIDLAAPMRIIKGKMVSFGALLVSVKSRNYCNPSSAASICDEMKSKADNDNCKSTLCLVVEFGQEAFSDDESCTWSEDKFLGPLVDGGNVAAVLRLPITDRFNLTSTFNSLTSFGEQQLLESHCFIRALSEVSKKSAFKGEDYNAVAEFCNGEGKSAHCSPQKQISLCFIE